MNTKTWLTDTLPSTRFPIYTRLNAADVLPGPVTPLAATMCWIPAVFPGWTSGQVEDFAFTSEELSEPSSVGALFFGHLYINQSTARVLGIRKGLSWQAIDAAFFNSPGAPPHVASPLDENVMLAARAPERMRWVLSASSFPDLEEDRMLADGLRRGRPDLRALSDRALVARARSMMPYERLMWRGELVAGGNAAVGPAVAASLLPPEKADLLVTCIGQAGEVDSAQPSYALWELSRLVRADRELDALFDRGVDAVTAQLPVRAGVFWTSFARFLAEFGYRGPGEWDLGAPSWESHPALALGLIERMRMQDDAQSPAARQAAQALATEAAVREAVSGMDAAAATTFRAAVISARRFAAWRERGKSNCVKVIHEARMPLMELGRRLVARGSLGHPAQVFQALDDELDALCLEGGSHLVRLSAREQAWRALEDLDLPMYLDAGHPLPDLDSLPRKSAARATQVAKGALLRGAAASQGVVEGTARVILRVDAIDRFQPGDILVAPQTDPAWTPLFLVAAGVVVDTGSLDSHAMIIARELGIPCVAGLPGASSSIPDGTRVRVDGARGTVEILG